MAKAVHCLAVIFLAAGVALAVPKLAALPAAWHGVSAEPLLGLIDIGDAAPDWITQAARAALDSDHWIWMPSAAYATSALAMASHSTISRTAVSVVRTAAA